MASPAPQAKSVELFYSYAHTDEPLCRELRKHLTALRRSGLISDWYDRKIEPGCEWNIQIQDAMDRAGIILLLISSDFLASEYISSIELPFALKRQDSGLARVIPILLRPVEVRDAPFSKLQMLPSAARPVTSWPNQDEAFSDIAGRLREILYSGKLELVASAPPAPLTATTQPRVLDTAVSSSVVLDEPTDVVTMVRRTESGGLKTILNLDRSYSATSDDVRSGSLEIDFPSNEFGRPLPAALELVLESPGFDPPRQVKKIRVPPDADSAVSVFMLTPKRIGTLRLNLQAVSGGVEIGSCTLKTSAMSLANAQPNLAYGVVSLTLQPAIGLIRPSPRAANMKVSSPFPQVSEPQYANPSITTKTTGTSAFSRRGAWIGIAASAAMLTLVVSFVTLRAPKAPVPMSESFPSQGESADFYLEQARNDQKRGNLKEALVNAQRAAKLAPNNPEIHLYYGELLETANHTDQALEEYKRTQALDPTADTAKRAARRAEVLR